jgi:hypothetical protein
MDTLDRTTLLGLAGRAEWPSVSLYLPADHLGIRTDADRIRLRNLAKQARERLITDGVAQAQADSLLAAALDLAADDSAWPGGPHALAHFSDAQGAETLWLDTTMPELAVMGDRFYLRPLYCALHDEPPVWALAIDSNRTRLFRLDRTSVEEVELPAGTPISMADETRYDQGEESLQYHTIPGATPQGVTGPGAAMFHGHGGAKDADKVQRERFMQELGRGVTERIGAESSEPLVLMGVDYLIEDFRATSAYAHVVPEQVQGATDYLSPADVQRAVLSALAPRFVRLRQADVNEYLALAGTGRISSDAGEIVAAAAAGRVKTLMIDDGEGPWGYFDRSDFTVTHLCPARPRYLRDTPAAPEGADALECGWDLIDLAAAETLRHGGSVRAFRGEDSPVSGAVAVFRY